jgi:hypothetical protein
MRLFEQFYKTKWTIEQLNNEQFVILKKEASVERRESLLTFADCAYLKISGSKIWGPRHAGDRNQCDI